MSFRDFLIRIMTTPASNTCPCGSGNDLKLCCQPLIQGKKKAATAEDLLRSRYTAFALGEVDYVLKTHHPKTANDVKREEIEEWSKSSDWLGLKIVQKEAGGENDEQGTIVFCATYQEKADAKAKQAADAPVPAPKEHWEQSLFEKHQGEWRFLDAKGIQVGPYKRAEPKVGRNDACPCGSGKKFKKCCG
jgi:SEC-C motif-containing protein